MLPGLDAFILRFMERSNGYRTGTKEVYRLYSWYCQENDLPQETKTMLSRTLNIMWAAAAKNDTYCMPVHKSHFMGERIWRNIKLTSEAKRILRTLPL
jgi:hypothetical protein